MQLLPALIIKTTFGTLTFNPGELSKNIPVVVNGDTLAEINETFFVNLSNPTNATLADAQGLGNIIDDDSSCPGPSFRIATPILVGSGPFSLVRADFNNDGRADLASANLVSNNVSVLLGGAGGLGSPSTIAVGAGPRSIASGDFNSDGKLDMITANFTSSGDSSGISILPGDGAGGFAPAINTNPVVGSCGNDFWLDVLNNRVPNNFRGMVCAFLTSAEYQQRFGASITRTNQDCSQQRGFSEGP